MTMGRKPADKVGLILRFDEALRRQLERAAKAHNRSMNAEIVQRLRASFQREDLEAFLARQLAVAAEKGADRAVFSFLRRLSENPASSSLLDKITMSSEEAPAQDLKEGEK
jgi:plasmid stability protein